MNAPHTTQRQLDQNEITGEEEGEGGVHRGLYVTIPIYFVLLLGCAIWANRTNRRQALRNGATVADTLSSHYLGGRSMGPILTTGSIFASFFSGYTVVGIPNEAYLHGFTALRWLAATMAIVVGYVGTGLRLRKAAVVRNHKTPLDFITDRFQSQILRYTVLLLQVTPSMFYITAQVVALKATCNSIFGLETDNPYPVLIIMAITLLLEWIGGLRCVAMTDCIQGGIMIVAYSALPILVAKHFGGWKDLLDTTTTNSSDQRVQEFYATPSREEQLDFWQFSITTFTFFTLPHLMQRTYAARDLVSLKYAYVGMTLGSWFFMVGATFIGTMAVKILATTTDNDDDEQQEQEEEITSPFTEVLNLVIDLGGFPKVSDAFLEHDVFHHDESICLA
jgi:sodium/proline symporter